MKIPFTNIELFKRQTPDTVEVDKNIWEQFLSGISKDATYKSIRPQMDPRETIMDSEVQIPMLPIPYPVLYDTAKYSDVLRTIFQSMRKEIFRHGIVIEEKFASKCIDCEEEYSSVTEECDKCGSSNMREPDTNQQKILEKFAKSVNDNGQDIINVSETVNDDVETTDDCYMIFSKDYYWDADGNIVKTVPVELIRADPRWTMMIADKRGRPGYSQNGDRQMICVVHRDALMANTERCPTCNRKTEVAYFRGTEPGGKWIYYTADECKHMSKYNPSLTYGFSPILSVWMKVITLMNMDKYMKDYYAKQRPPRGLLFVNTPNMESLTKAWNWMTDEWKKNPHTIPPIAVEQTQGTRGNLVNFIDFMKSMEEMQFIEARNEYRKAIGAVYGVMPLFQGDTSTSGGLNNEGLQITVTNRAIADGQGVFNDGFYPWICDQMGITDYKMSLSPNEEQDNVAKEELFGKKIQNAKALQEMGFSVTLTNDNEFEFDPIDEPVEKKDPFAQQMGGMPGQDPMGAPPDNFGNPGGEQDFSGQPDAPDFGGDQNQMDNQIKPEDNFKSMDMVKGRVYLRQGQEAPKGVNLQTGASGGKYYETEARVSRRSLMNKPIDEMSEDELSTMQDWMQEDQVAYTQRDLTSAMSWLKNHPNLRERWGSKYYEFAVQVATAINRGEDPDAIDWEALDSQIPMSESLAGQRYADINAAMQIKVMEKIEKIQTSHEIKK